MLNKPPTVSNNKKLFRFEIELGINGYATLEYRWLKANMVLMHTIVPAAERGKGYGGELVRHVLNHARNSGLKVIVYCPYVSEYLKKHPEYLDLVADR